MRRGGKRLRKEEQGEEKVAGKNKHLLTIINICTRKEKKENLNNGTLQST